MTDQPAAEPIDGKILDDAPEWLTGEGRKAWATVYPTLRRSSLLKAQDQIALARYCDYTARWLKLRQDVDAKGETYETESKHGKLQRINPDLVAMLRIEAVMISLEDRFGLAPATRLKILKDLAASNGSLPFDAPPQQDAAKRKAASPVGMLRVVNGRN